MIRLEGVSKHYLVNGERIVVLDRVDLCLERADFTVLQAPSGSGKSTLLNLIGVLDQPSEGQVHVAGQNVARLSDPAAANLRNRTIGFIFQSFHLIPVLTAAENVEYPLQIMGVRRAERKERARAVLASVGLDRHRHQVPARLSGGQRQRVAIARALVCRPAVILADEPTANLDRRTGEEVMRLVSDLNEREGLTILIATHDPMVADHCRRRLIIAEGRVHHA